MTSSSAHWPSISALALDPTVTSAELAALKNPHTFLTNLQFTQSAPVAIAAQQQIGIFLASDGAIIVDPDGASPLFEVRDPLEGTSRPRRGVGATPGRCVQQRRGRSFFTRLARA